MSIPFVVVSDFDGTITQKDLVVALTTHVAPKNQQLITAIQRRDVSLRTGLAELFSTLPSDGKREYESYLHDTARIRPGYYQFEKVLKAASIPFYIVSNGLDFMLDAVLLDSTTERIVNHANFDTDRITIEWQYPCLPPCPGGCGLCKYQVVDELRQQYGVPIVFIGDGVTDYNGARHADRVFSRGQLSNYLHQENVPYTPFETFDDILESLFVVHSEGART